MNNFNNNNYPYFQPIGQSNVIYVVNVADVIKDAWKWHTSHPDGFKSK